MKKNSPPKKKILKKTQKKKGSVGRSVEWTEDKRKILGESLVEFCKLDHVFHLVQWTREQNKTSAWWHDLRKKYPDLLDYHTKAKEILGGKILRNAFEHGNSWAIQTFLPMYLSDLKEKIVADAELELDRRMRLEKYKNSLNQAREDEAIAKIDNFDQSTELAYELIKMKKFMASKGIGLEVADE